MHSYSEMQSTPAEQLERDFGLRVASFRCDVRGVRRYLRDGASVNADVTAVNSDGNTPLDLEMKPCMKKLFRKYFAIVVRRCAFRSLPADLASHVASFMI